jgi:hypothetical protein
VYPNMDILLPAHAGWSVPLGSLACAPGRISQGFTGLFVRDELDQSICPSMWVGLYLSSATKGIIWLALFNLVGYCSPRKLGALAGPM